MDGEEQAPLEHKAFPDGEFKEEELHALGSCNALTNQEAKIVLQRFIDANSKAHKLWAPPPLAVKAMEYLNKVEAKTEVEHSESVTRLREDVQKQQIFEYEMALLTNLTPERAEEAMSLVPSLKDGRFEGEAQHALENALEQIITLKQLQ